MEFPKAQFTDRNLLTGYAVWSVLTAVISYRQGSIDPQLDLAEDTEQAITLEWDTDRPDGLRSDYFQWEVRVTINPELSPEDHAIDLIETSTEPEFDLFSQVHYILTVRQLLVALPWIERREFSKIRGLLNSTNYDYHGLKAINKAFKKSRSI